MIAFNTDGKNIDIKRYRVTLTKENTLLSLAIILVCHNSFSTPNVNSAYILRIKTATRGDFLFKEYR